MARLLLVEDDPQVGRQLSAGLQAGGHDVSLESTGAGGLALAAVQPFDLILLDLGLPDMNGMDVCRRLRMAATTSVIVMLTASGDEMDVISALESGADDYLTKPARLVELQARIRAHLRRRPPTPADSGRRVGVGELQLDFEARRCWLGQVEVQLRAKEFDLLAMLVEGAGSAIKRDDLMSEVWDEHWYGSTKTLDVHVASLRRKLGDASKEAGVVCPSITTLRGHGYRLETGSPN